MDTNKLKNAGYNNRFADYFVICGLDLSSGLEPDNFAGDNLQQTPLERPYKCKVLGHYPENVPWNPFDFNAVCMLSLPHGLQFHTQKHILEPKFHSFVITKEDGRRTYGSSYVFFEEVSNRKICSAMQTLQAMHWAELSSGQSPQTKPLDHNTRSLPRHFKLTAHRPKAAQSYYDHAKDTLYVTKSITLISQMPYVHASRLFLSGIYRCWKDQHHISIDSYVYNLLYQVTVPQPGRSLSFYCYPDIKTTIQRPSAIEELPLFDFPLRELFSMLSVESVLQLFTCLQLENQILLCSSEYQKLMLVAESMLCLLFPFTWPHVYVPILPASLQHFLDAPVPFVMGLHSRENRINIPSEANLCYVDLDTKVMQLPEELPSFPQKAEFVAEINDLLCKYKVSCDVDKNSNSLTNSPCCDKTNSGGDIMTSSCTLPASSWRPRKHSWANDLDEDTNHFGSGGSDTLRRIISLARKTRVSLEGIGSLDWDGYAEPDVDDNDADHILDEEGLYTQELLFNNALREIFLNRFVHIFSNYENFIIQPSQDREQWMNERETMQNFDKATFLSDQPQQHLPFLSRFIETQMFATLVDNKIMSAWMKVEPNLRVFERRIKLLRKRYCDGLVRTPYYEACLTINDSERLLEKRMASVNIEVSPPQELLSNHVSRNTRAGFPLLDSVLLNQELALRSRRQKNVSSYKKLSHSISSVSLEELDSGCEVLPPQQHQQSLPRKSPSEAHPLGTGYSARALATLQPTPPDMSPALIAQTNWNFVETLLKDCKAKTKRMLVEKMGMEGVELGNTGQTSLVEENTLIASLCDLLERIWSHGLQAKQGKSALWAHLMNYQELEECDDSNKSIDPNFLTPDLSSPGMDRSPLMKQSRSRSETRTSSRQFQNHDESVGQPFLRPLPYSLTYDMRCIQSMAEIKTQIGYARAFVRLALEKKVLSRHLKTLLADSALLKSQYKRYAFLRCEEEKEQFIYHLLTLNAVDYYCFTNTYTNTRMLYRVAIFPTRKSSASSTTANCWVAVSGSNGETQQLPVPKGALQFTFTHRNLGLLTTLRIGHDNSGMSPKWMVEHIIARNEVTGHTYLFPCGRWLGRGVDDDSTERLLVGEKLADGRHPSCSSSGSNSPRVRSPSVPPPRRALPIADIQHMLGDCLNRIVKYFYRAQTKDGPNSSLTMLLCGENGLVYCLENVFFHGYKSIRLFGRNLYVWDFIARVKDEKEHMSRHNDIVRYYCHLVDRIQSYSNSLGKDGRFQQFVCVSIRDRKLDLCIDAVMVESQAVLDMYEEQSFLRDPNLRMYLTQMLHSLNEFDIVLEKSLTQGISAFR